MFNIYGVGTSSGYGTAGRQKGYFTLFIETLHILIVITLIFVIVGMAGFAYMNFFSYVDLANNCYIKIEKNVIFGNRETIKEAITNIKYNNPVVYSDICHYVDKITESTCVKASPNSSKVLTIGTKGCYIKGTKTIFIEPVAGEGVSVVDKRGEIISKYSQESRKYWQNLF